MTPTGRGQGSKRWGGMVPRGLPGPSPPEPAPAPEQLADHETLMGYERRTVIMLAALAGAVLLARRLL